MTDRTEEAPWLDLLAELKLIRMALERPSDDLKRFASLAMQNMAVKGADIEDKLQFGRQPEMVAEFAIAYAESLISVMKRKRSTI